MQNHKLAIVGLGYVGLPLAVEFGKYYPTIGFDINHKRLRELKDGVVLFTSFWIFALDFRKK